jgi:hypothetical protein
MLTLLKLLQSLVNALQSGGTPAEVAAGIALGSTLGLTPLTNVHNLGIVALIVILNVSFGGGMLGRALFVPVGIAPDAEASAHLGVALHHAASSNLERKSRPWSSSSARSWDG